MEGPSQCGDHVDLEVREVSPQKPPPPTSAGENDPIREHPDGFAC